MKKINFKSTDFLSQLTNLNPNDMSLWPKTFQYVLGVILIIIMVVFGWYFFIDDVQNKITTEQEKEIQLKEDFSNKLTIANRLFAYSTKKSTLAEILANVEAQLPNAVEMDVLLSDLSKAGRDSDLDFDLFKPGQELVKDFYIEQQINIQLKGTFNNIIEFFSKVNEMPRIVKIDDFTLTKNDNDNLINMMAVAKIFSYKVVNDVSKGNK